MKKIIKMLDLLLLAAMVFTSCNQQSKEDKDDEKKNIIKPLFDVEDLTVPAAKIEMMVTGLLEKSTKKELRLTSLSSQ